MGGGAAFLDFDKDGNLDALLVRGSTIASFLKSGGDPVVSLFRGDGRGHFTDVTRASKLEGPRGWGMGVAVADYDNDGWQDFYVTGYGRNFLFRNRKDGTFEEVAERAGVAVRQWSMGAAFGDINRDGHLDLYVANYLEYPFANLPPRDSSCNYRGFPVFCGPRGLRGSRDSLFLGHGRGGFRDVTEAQGIDPGKRYSLQPVIADYDNDGWPDIFVATDLMGNYLYRNRGDGTLEDSAVLAGAAYSEDGVEQGSMGADFADFDHDGWLDFYYTNSSYQSNILLLNAHDGSFTNVTNPAGHGASTYLQVGWGIVFSDLDNDGWEDIAVVNGHLYPEADRFDLGLKYRQKPLIFLNRGNRTFAEAGERLGFQKALNSRGLAAGDYDNDGRLDLLINNLDGAPSLYHNELPPKNWLIVHLSGTASNRSAVGARLTLRAGSLVLTREVISGASYLSSNDLRVHFGLGDHAYADTLEIRWPSGAVQRTGRLAAGQILSIAEAAGGASKLGPGRSDR